VLQAMILTQEERMLLTPTYHVFEMYKGFKDAAVIPVNLSAPAYKHGEFEMPAVHAAAARAQDGRLQLALTNLDPDEAARLTLTITGRPARLAGGTLLTAQAMNAINTFDKPDMVKPQPFKGARFSGERLQVELPAKSVVVLTLQ
jgi:alpha-N-arabinofuranosidase